MFRRSCNFFQTYVARDSNGVPFIGSAAKELSVVAMQRGFKSSVWFAASSVLFRGQSPRDGEMPVVLSLGSGAHVELFNEDQLIQCHRIPSNVPKNVNGKPFTKNFGELLAMKGFSNHFWGTADYLKEIFDADVLPGSVGATHKIFGFERNQEIRFFNANETNKPELFVEENVPADFVLLPNRKSARNADARRLHAHAMRYSMMKNISPFWGTRSTLSFMGGVLKPSAVGCPIPFPTFRLLYNVSQLENSDDFTRRLSGL